MSERQVYARLNHPVIVLYAAAGGGVKAMVIGEITCSELPDNVAVTGLRTAATSAVGTDVLARKDSEKLGILGSRGQAMNHLVALACIRKFKEVRVYSPNKANRGNFADDMGSLLNINIKPVSSPKEVIQGMDVVLCATNTSVPVFDGEWLEPGVHVTTIVGSNIGLVSGGFTKAKRREIDDTTVARSNVIGIASVQQAVQDQQGDIFDPVEKGIIRWEQLVEIGEIIAGKREGRTSAEQITLFKNNAGQGVADVALGALVLKKVIEKGGGQVLDT
jgi:alanine dehydrogenase